MKHGPTRNLALALVFSALALATPVLSQPVQPAGPVVASYYAARETRRGPSRRRRRV